MLSLKKKELKERKIMNCFMWKKEFETTNTALLDLGYFYFSTTEKLRLICV